MKLTHLFLIGLSFCWLGSTPTLAQQATDLLAENSETAESSMAQNTEEKVEKKKSKKKEKKKKDLKWEGNFKFAFRYARNRSRTAANVGGFELSGLNLKAEYKLQKGLKLKGWYQIRPKESELKEGYARIEDREAIFDRIQMGLQRRLFYLDSDLETNSLNKIALYQIRDFSLLTRISFLDQWQWLFQLANGGQLNTRDISPRRVVKQDVILADSVDKREAFGTNSRELITGLNYRTNSLPGIFKNLKMLLFFSFRPVSDNDTADLSTLSEVPGYTGVHTGRTSYTKYGLNLSWKYNQWRSYSQAVNAKIRDLVRDFFSTEWQYRFGKWRAMLAYSQQYISVDADFTAPLSWNRQRLTLGGRYQWLESAKVTTEYTTNREDTGGKPLKNEELLVSWIYSF